MNNAQSRESIDRKIINLFKLSKITTNSILILNKIDTLKNKKMLLKVVKNVHNDLSSSFSDIFMISALKGDGVDDLKVKKI